MKELFSDFDVLFVRGNSFISRAISSFTKSPYTHVGIYHNGILWESTARGVAPGHVDNYKDSDFDILSLNDIEYENYSKRLSDSLYRIMPNVRYDWLNFFIYQPIRSITGKWYGKDTMKRMICSEFVMRVISESHPPQMDGMVFQMDSITPGALHMILLSYRLAKFKIKKRGTLISDKND